MNLKSMTVEQRREFSSKGGIARRSPESQRAWDQADTIRLEARTLNIARLAKKYNISTRTMRRIVSGK